MFKIYNQTKIMKCCVSIIIKRLYIYSKSQFNIQVEKKLLNILQDNVYIVYHLKCSNLSSPWRSNCAALILLDSHVRICLVCTGRFEC